MVLQTTLATGLGRVLPSELPQLGPFSVEMGNVQNLSAMQFFIFTVFVSLSSLYIHIGAFMYIFNQKRLLFCREATKVGCK